MMKSKNIDKVRDEVKRIGETLAASAAKASRITITVRMAPDLHQRVKIAAVNQKRSTSDLITAAVEKYLADMKD